jgi:hypothetical protein
VDDAAAEVANAGLTYQTFEYQSDEPEGTVVSTDPEAGTELDPGTLVAIYYSTGPDPGATATATADAGGDDNKDEGQKEAKDNNGGNGGGGNGGGGNGGGGNDGNKGKKDDRGKGKDD